MVIKVERAEEGSLSNDGELTGRIEKAIRKETLVSGKVEIVAYQSLPRTERKAKRVFDHRA